MIEKKNIAVIGLGYVGLPLALEFAKTRSIVGFDIDQKRVNELRDGHDRTMEVTSRELVALDSIVFTADIGDIEKCNFYIVTVPTPIDNHKRPDLTLLIKASEMVAGVLKRGDIVVYESTVYPGATEEDCVPVLEQVSGLAFNQDFFVGYSPERINPGDKEHKVANIRKITSGSTPEIAEIVDSLYNEVITVGTHKAESIRMAEAAKVIENTQRDVNIALVNELAIIFNKLGIDTEGVLRAAGTKWNFLPFRPGLVGGHCIGVDPYYLTYKAEAIGYHPQMILAGRRINDDMGFYVTSQLIKAMINKKIRVDNARVLIMGLAFKENCPDLRNTKVVNILEELKTYNIVVDTFDPCVNAAEAKQEYDITLVSAVENGIYDAVIIAVAHKQFQEMGVEAIRAFGKQNHILYDLKYILKEDESDIRL